MEESLKKYTTSEFSSFLNSAFDLPGQDIKSYSPLTLAYIGDAVFELLIRNMIVARANTSVNTMHNHATKIAQAKAQADIYFAIKDKLTEEENSIFKRGRNAKSATTPKNATLGDYRIATGVEALIGYLYLENKFNRIIELFKSELIIR